MEKKIPLIDKENSVPMKRILRSTVLETSSNFFDKFCLKLVLYLAFTINFFSIFHN